MSLQPQSISLETYQYDKIIIADIIHQLEKDILLSGLYIDVKILETEDLKKLVSTIQHFIETVFAQNKNALFSLFYRIDVPQHLLTDHSFALLAELIIKRELIKVLIRKNYKTE